MKLEMWWPVALGFAAGAMIGSAVLLADLAWHRSHDHPPSFTPSTADLTGRWEGTEHSGTTFVVDRQADGSFTGKWDFSRSVTPHQPPVVDAAGRFAVSGPSYGYYFTRSSDPAWLNRPPVVRTLHDCTATELKYDIEADDSGRELKK